MQRWGMALTLYLRAFPGVLDGERYDACFVWHPPSVHIQPKPLHTLVYLFMAAHLALEVLDLAGTVGINTHTISHLF